MEAESANAGSLNLKLLLCISGSCMVVVWKIIACWACAQFPAFLSSKRILCVVPSLVSLAGDLASQRRDVDLLLEGTEVRVCLFGRKQVHIIDD